MNQRESELLMFPPPKSERLLVGPFIVNKFKTPFAFSPTEDVQVKKGDTCLTLDLSYVHLTSTSYGARRYSKMGLEEIGLNIQQNYGENWHVLGLTNEHIGRYANALGFNTSVLKTYSSDVRFWLEKDFSHSAAAKRGAAFGDAVICYLSGSEFINRFLPSSV